MTDLSKLVKPLVWEPNRLIGFHAFCPLFGTVHYVDDTARAKDDDAKRAARIIAALDPEALAKIRADALREAAELVDEFRRAPATAGLGCDPMIEAILAMIDKEDQA